MSNKNDNIYPVGAIKHDEEQRASIPTTELAGEESLVTETMTAEGQYRQFKHDFDRGRDPELYWLGKYKNDVEDTQSPDLHVDTRSLYRHEEINPEMLINQLFTLKVDDKAAGVASLLGMNCRQLLMKTNCSASQSITGTMKTGATVWFREILY